MNATLSLITKHPIADTRPIVMEAFKDQLNFAHTRYLKFESDCKEYESKFGMTSESFLNKFDSGELGDDLKWFDWYAAARGKKLWSKKYQILSEITWSE